MLKHMGTLFTALVILMTPFYLHAGETGRGHWIGVKPQINLTESLNFATQFQLRNTNDINFSLVRSTVNFKSSPNLTLTAGFDVFSLDVEEYRLWPQLNYKMPWLWNLVLRVRQEFRKLAGSEFISVRTRIQLQKGWKVATNTDFGFFNELYYEHSDFNDKKSYSSQNWLGTFLSYKTKRENYTFKIFFENALTLPYDKVLYGELVYTFIF